jgi:hypothetical protein
MDVPLLSCWLFLPLLLQGLEEMTGAIYVVLMLADRPGGTAYPTTLLGGRTLGQATGL